MLRGLFALLIAVAPLVMLAALTGCEPEIKTHQSSTRIEESEPQMVSPGEEVLVPDN